MTSRRHEVWGSPIQHSLSPVLHRAAHQALGVDWDYRAAEITLETLDDAFLSLDPVVEGLSLTMPLKEAILELVSDHRGPVDLLHAANTAVRTEDGWWLDNTDWWGARQTLERFGGVTGASVWLLGAGATARSLLFALSGLGPADVVTVVRSPDRAVVNAVLAQTLSLSHRVLRFDELSGHTSPEWVISTLPGGGFEALETVASAAGKARLFDVSYRPWPSALAAAWRNSSSADNLGLWMLALQALAQVRAFVGGDSLLPLDNEAAVFAQMCEAVGLPHRVGE